MNKTHSLLLALLLTVLIANSIYFLKILNPPQKTFTTVQEITDGDTLVTIQNEKIRLANINTPEKNEPGYEEAKEFLKQLENKTIEIESLGTDKYQRTLARIYYKNSYVNLGIIQQGLGTKFLVDESELNEFAKAETEAIKKQKGIWKHSQFFNCLQSQINAEEEIIKLTNNCNPINLKDFAITDESRKRFNLPDLQITELNIHSVEGNNNATDIFLNQKQPIWNNDRDTLYIFDDKNYLVHSNSYGY